MSGNRSKTPLQVAAHRLAGDAIREGYEPQALHEYTDSNGALVFARIRLKQPETGEKWIRPVMPDGSGGFRLGEPAFPNGKPLYRLHELGEHPGDPVFVVEGEWCADALAKMGVLATTSGGADSAERADWQPLAGREVTIWPDNDEPGARYGHTVRDALRALGCTVRVVDVAALGLPAKGDAVDWLHANPNATAAHMAALPMESPRGEPARPADKNVTTGQASVASAESEQASELVPDEVVISRLAALPPLAYDRVRKEEAKALGVRESTLDREVERKRRPVDDGAMGFKDVDAWPEPVRPAALLHEVAGAVRRFIVCQVETAHAVALWVAMTWFIDVVQVAPLAVITAPEKRCGKSQLLSVLGRLCFRPLEVGNISPAALFRCIDAWKPTLLVDETDAFMRENDELRGLLNCGHTRNNAYVVRTVGEDFEPKRFNVWGAKALAGIGHLADTIMDRAITLELRRKLPHEQADRLRYVEPGLFADLASKLARFAADYRETISRARPVLPPLLNDRAQDNWEPLLAIADVAGDDWPDLARAAALKLSGADSPTMSTGTELLADIQDVFAARGADRISTATLIAALCADKEKPWATYNRGQEITPRQLAKRLGEYGIKSKNVRIGSETPKGVELSQFTEAFSRYLPSASATAPQTLSDAGLGVAFPGDVTATSVESATDGASVADVADRGVVAATPWVSATEEPASNLACGGVADSEGGTPQALLAFTGTGGARLHAEAVHAIAASKKALPRAEVVEHSQSRKLKNYALP